MAPSLALHTRPLIFLLRKIYRRSAWKGKVTAAGWQVTLCDPIWHVISRSGVVKFHELLYSAYFTVSLLFYMDVGCKAFCCRHINFKTAFQSAPEHAIFIQKIEKKFSSPDPTFNRRGYPTRSHPPRRVRRVGFSPSVSKIPNKRPWEIECCRPTAIKATITTTLNPAIIELLHRSLVAESSALPWC